MYFYIYKCVKILVNINIIFANLERLVYNVSGNVIIHYVRNFIEINGIRMILK